MPMDIEVGYRTLNRFEQKHLPPHDNQKKMYRTKRANGPKSKVEEQF